MSHSSHPARSGERARRTEGRLRLVVTGGAGFIGSHLIRHLTRRHPRWSITVLDALTYAADRRDVAAILEERGGRLVVGRVEAPRVVRQVLAGADAVAHLAAETHVDRSIEDGRVFVTTNVLGTQVLLEAAAAAGVARFLHVSTDEVYGSLGEEGRFTEASPLEPRSPYAASKAAADLMVLAHARSHGLAVVVVRPSNTYGPRQHLEKLLPVLVTNALDGRPLPLYGDGGNVREWLWVGDLCRGLEAALLRAPAGAVLNMGGGEERSNVEVARAVLERLGLPAGRIALVADRPGHDRRYALDSARARACLGWQPQVTFVEGLRRTIRWYSGNEPWWRQRKAASERSSRGWWTDARRGPVRGGGS